MAEAVVLDHGSATVKAGYANPDADPTVLLPSSFCLSPVASGVSAAGVPPVPLERDLVNVLDGGRIHDWDVMEDIWQWLLYDQLGWEQGNEGPMLVCEPILTPKIDRETLAQIMFEKFNVSGFFACEAPVLSLYSMGRLSGCCVDVGHTKTDVAAVSDGALIPSSACRMDGGGWDLEVLMGRLLARGNPDLRHVLLCPQEQPASDQSLRRMKEQFCVAALSAQDYEERVTKHDVSHYTLPDGQVVKVRGEGMQVGEALFRPQVVGQSAQGITDLLLQAVADAALAAAAGGPESDRLRSLVESVAVVGGVATMPGFAPRFVSELSSTLPPSLHPAAMKPPEYMPENTVRFSTWTGGAIVAKIAFAQNQHVTKGEYDERGPSVVSRKLA